MTNKPNSGTVSVSRELLERIAAWLERANQNSDEDIAECVQLRAILAQPADHQGEPVALPTDWRSLADQLQEVGLAYWKVHDRERDRGAVKFLHNEETGALFVVTRGEYADQLKDFIFSLDCPAQPATAKVDEQAEALKKARANTAYDGFDNGVD
ncbi:hypothetical protein V2J81_23215 [Pseudomonas alliivorans]|nr:hypothetical protein [Pseudomonas alliivorans]